MTLSIKITISFDESSSIKLGMPLTSFKRPSRGNSSETSTYLGSMRSPAPPLGPLGPQWIEGAPTTYLDLVVTSSRSQWPCLQVTVLWVDTWKECGYHLTTPPWMQIRKKRGDFLCPCPSLARCRYRLFGSSTLVSLTEISSIDVNDIAQFIKLSGWFSSLGQSCFNCAALALTNFSLLGSEELGQYRGCVHNGLPSVLK